MDLIMFWGLIKATNYWNYTELEQLEYLYSENTPAALWLPILLIYMRFQVKYRQSQNYKFERFKFWNFAINLTRDTPSEVA